MKEPLSIKTPEETVDFLEEYCQFEGGDIYVLSILARPRENPAVGKDKPVFREIIASKGTIHEKVRKLQTLAENYTLVEDSEEDLTFRMYVSVNGRDVLKSFHGFQEHLMKLGQKYMNGHTASFKKIKRLDGEWISMLEKDVNKSTKYFIIDVDEDSIEKYEEVYKILSEITTVEVAIKTLNGFHIIVQPFNYPSSPIPDLNNVEIKRDDMLYLRKI